MKLKFTILSLLYTVWMTAQTTVQFSEPHQFFNDSDSFLNIKIQVNNIDEYASKAPIIVQLFSNLKDPGIIGITGIQGMDKIIFPEEYVNGIEIQIPVNLKALRNSKSFSLSLHKKGINENFTIFQGIHTIIINKDDVDKSYVSISAIEVENTIASNIVNSQKIEIPFRLEAQGVYLPVEADEAFARVKIKGVSGSDSLKTYTVIGAISNHKILVEKSNTPKIYEKLTKIITDEENLELEISELEHKSRYYIEIDPANTSVSFSLKKVAGESEILIEETRIKNSLDASYSFYSGVNFDFNNNFKFEEAYFEMDISLYNLFKNKWGLRAGIYKNNNSRSLAESFQYEWVNNTLVEHNSEDIIYTQKILDVVANVSTESLGFYFQLPYKVIESGRFSAFVSPHIELIKRIEKYTYEVVGESTEQTIIADVYDPVTSLKYATLWLENTTQYWDSYLGMGFPMLYRNVDKGFEVFVSPILGAGYPQQAADSISLGAIANSGLSFFGAFQFYLVVSTKENLGIKLGTDVRKYFYTEQKPTISVNLSTKIDLSGIMGLAGGN